MTPDVFVDTECPTSLSSMSKMHDEDDDDSLSTPVTPTDVQDVDLENTRTTDRLFHSEALTPLQVLFPWKRGRGSRVTREEKHIKDTITSSTETETSRLFPSPSVQRKEIIVAKQSTSFTRRQWSPWRRTSDTVPETDTCDSPLLSCLYTELTLEQITRKKKVILIERRKEEALQQKPRKCLEKEFLVMQSKMKKSEEEEKKRWREVYIFVRLKKKQSKWKFLSNCLLTVVNCSGIVMKRKEGCRYFVNFFFRNLSKSIWKSSKVTPLSSFSRFSKTLITFFSAKDYETTYDLENYLNRPTFSRLNRHLTFETVWQVLIFFVPWKWLDSWRRSRNQ